jgi:hypothetical protein
MITAHGFSRGNTMETAHSFNLGNTMETTHIFSRGNYKGKRKPRLLSATENIYVAFVMDALLRDT